MTVKIEGYTSLTGRPEVILSLMQEARMFDAGMPTEDYIEVIRETAWKCFGIYLTITGDTPAERAESLLRSMHKNEMLTIEEE